MDEEPPAWRRYDLKRVSARMPWVEGGDPIFLTDVSRAQFELLKRLARSRFEPFKYKDAIDDFGLKEADIIELEQMRLIYNGFETTMPWGGKGIWERGKWIAIGPTGLRFVHTVAMRLNREGR